jgi:GNAT superfamily N-acetyltransferase
MNPTPALTLSNSPEPEVAQIIRVRLDGFNDAIVGFGDRLPLHVIVRASEDGEIVGGISGGTSLGLLTINLVYLPEIFRGTGLGTCMMAMAEQEARRRGCRAGVVYTMSFQAPGFYQRMGWRVLARYRVIRRGPAAYSSRRTFVDFAALDAGLPSFPHWRSGRLNSQRRSLIR